MLCRPFPNLNSHDDAGLERLIQSMNQLQWRLYFIKLELLGLTTGLRNNGGFGSTVVVLTTMLTHLLP